MRGGANLLGADGHLAGVLKAVPRPVAGGLAVRATNVTTASVLVPGPLRISPGDVCCFYPGNMTVVRGSSVDRSLINTFAGNGYNLILTGGIYCVAIDAVEVGATGDFVVLGECQVLMETTSGPGPFVAPVEGDWLGLSGVTLATLGRRINDGWGMPFGAIGFCTQAPGEAQFGTDVVGRAFLLGPGYGASYVRDTRHILRIMADFNAATTAAAPANQETYDGHLYGVQTAGGTPNLNGTFIRSARRIVGDAVTAPYIALTTQGVDNTVDGVGGTVGVLNLLNPLGVPAFRMRFIWAQVGTTAGVVRRFGLAAVILTALPANGVFFSYTTAGTVHLIVRAASVTTLDFDTGITPTANVYHTYEVMSAGSGFNQLDVFVDDVLVGKAQLGSNTLPNVLCGLSAGSSSIAATQGFDIDLIEFECTRFH